MTNKSTNQVLCWSKTHIKIPFSKSIVIIIPVCISRDIHSRLHRSHGRTIHRSSIANVIAVRLSVPVVAAIDVDRGNVVGCQRGGSDSGSEVANQILSFLNHGIDLHKKGEREKRSTTGAVNTLFKKRIRAPTPIFCSKHPYHREEEQNRYWRPYPLMYVYTTRLEFERLRP